MESTTKELLGEYAMLLNKYGADSPEAKAFLENNSYNQDFSELASLSNKLKRALTAPAQGSLAVRDQ